MSISLIPLASLTLNIVGDRIRDGLNADLCIHNEKNVYIYNKGWSQHPCGEPKLRLP